MLDQNMLDRVACLLRMGRAFTAENERARSFDRFQHFLSSQGAAIHDLPMLIRLLMRANEATESMRDAAELALMHEREEHSVTKRLLAIAQGEDDATVSEPQMARKFGDEPLRVRRAQALALLRARGPELTNAAIAKLSRCSATSIATWRTELGVALPQPRRTLQNFGSPMAPGAAPGTRTIADDRG
jgi:hypothetical protein